MFFEVPVSFAYAFDSC